MRTATSSTPTTTIAASTRCSNRYAPDGLADGPPEQRDTFRNGDTSSAHVATGAARTAGTACKSHGLRHPADLVEQGDSVRESTEVEDGDRTTVPRAPP